MVTAVTTVVVQPSGVAVSDHSAHEAEEVEVEVVAGSHVPQLEEAAEEVVVGSQVPQDEEALEVVVGSADQVAQVEEAADEVVVGSADHEAQSSAETRPATAATTAAEYFILIDLDDDRKDIEGELRIR